MQWRSVGADYSPYGTQMFLTCVAARRNSRPSPSSRSSQSRSCQVAQVRFMFDADASSTNVPSYVIVTTKDYSLNAVITTFNFNGKPMARFPYVGRYAPSE